MKIHFLFILGLFTFIVNAQKTGNNINSNNVAVHGYDVVSYFSNKAVKGKVTHTHTYENIKYRFSTKNNLEKFKLNPINYLPQYGGWCAYAMGTKGKKLTINPKTFEIRNHKLYLFYNAYFTNALNDWLDEGPKELRKKADKNWKKIENR